MLYFDLARALTSCCDTTLTRYVSAILQSTPTARCAFRFCTKPRRTCSMRKKRWMKNGGPFLAYALRAGVSRCAPHSNSLAHSRFVPLTCCFFRSRACSSRSCRCSRTPTLLALPISTHRCVAVRLVALLAVASQRAQFARMCFFFFFFCFFLSIFARAQVQYRNDFEGYKKRVRKLVRDSVENM